MRKFLRKTQAKSLFMHIIIGHENDFRRCSISRREQNRVEEISDLTGKERCDDEKRFSEMQKLDCRAPTPSGLAMTSAGGACLLFSKDTKKLSYLRERIQELIGLLLTKYRQQQAYQSSDFLENITSVFMLLEHDKLFAGKTSGTYVYISRLPKI